MAPTVEAKVRGEVKSGQQLFITTAMTTSTATTGRRHVQDSFELRNLGYTHLFWEGESSVFKDKSGTAYRCQGDRVICAWTGSKV